MVAIRRSDFDGAVSEGILWLYLFGVLTFWGGLSSMDSGSEWGKLDSRLPADARIRVFGREGISWPVKSRPAPTANRASPRA